MIQMMTATKLCFKPHAFAEVPEFSKWDRAKIDEGNICLKQWFLRGEISASVGPKDSLPETSREHDTMVPPKLLVSTQTCEQIEHVIRQRIVDVQFDDVIIAPP